MATASLLATCGELGDSIRRVEIVKVGVAETSSGHTTNGVVVVVVVILVVVTRMMLI